MPKKIGFCLLIAFFFSLTENRILFPAKSFFLKVGLFKFVKKHYLFATTINPKLIPEKLGQYPKNFIT